VLSFGPLQDFGFSRSRLEARNQSRELLGGFAGGAAPSQEGKMMTQNHVRKSLLCGSKQLDSLPMLASLIHRVRRTDRVPYLFHECGRELRLTLQVLGG
jgi:hypothetical protein